MAWRPNSKVFSGAAVVGGGSFEAGAQLWELCGDLAGFGQVVAYQLVGVTAIAAEFPAE
jgi:hypothetical protein